MRSLWTTLKRKYPEYAALGIPYNLSNVPYSSSNSARTSDLLFMAAVILSEDPFQFVDENLNIENLDDPRAKDLFSALQEAHKEGFWMWKGFCLSVLMRLPRALSEKSIPPVNYRQSREDHKGRIGSEKESCFRKKAERACSSSQIIFGGYRSATRKADPRRNN